MNIKNNILYREREAIAITISPMVDVYNDTTATLSPEQEVQLVSEKAMLKTLISLDSIKKLLNIADTITPINQYPLLLEQVKSDMENKGLPEKLLDYVFSKNFDSDHINAYILPNNLLPISSLMRLKNVKNSYLYDSNSMGQRRWSLVDRYEVAAKELKDCKDEDFVAKKLEPLSAKILAFDNEHTDLLKAIQKKEVLFNEYLTNIGLKEEFDLFEKTQLTASDKSKATTTTKLKV